MTLAHEIEHALRDELPADLHDRVPRLAQVLADVTNGTLTKETAQKRLKDADMEPLLRDLAGQQVQADHALLSFGQGSHLGDVTIGDVAGGNITKLSLRGDIVMGNKVLTFGIGAAIILTFGIFSASVIFNIGPLSPIAQDVWQQFFPPFEPAGEDESLIIVADFRDESEGQYTGSNPASFLYHSLTDRVQRDGLNIRVERLYDVLDANTVRQTGETYSATLVLWGEYNSGAVIPVLERIRLPERRTTDEEGAFLAIADPERIQIGELTNISATGSYITLFTLGADLYAAEEYDTARDYLTSAINAVPNDAEVTAQPDEAYFLRGNIAYLPPQDYLAAQRDYEAALELSPEDANTLNNLGIVAESQGNYAEAIEYYEQSLALQRELGDRQGEANTLNNLGVVAFRQGNYPEAIEYYEQSLALQRELGDAAGIASTSWNLGLVYEDEGDLARAVPLMQHSIDFYASIGHPDAAGNANRLCWNGSLGGVAEEVVETCEQAVELATDQEKPFHVDSRGLNRALTGDTAGAIEDFQFFVEQLQGIEPQDEEMASAIAEAVAPREAWIAALEAGENPFDEATLEELRNE